MSKERLTERFSNGKVAVKGCGANCNYGYEYCVNHVEDCPTIIEVYDKLAEYEDLEEQGLLLRLPVAVGSKAYEIIEDTVPEHHFYIAEYEVQDVSAKAVKYADDWNGFDYPNLYFSRAEAEEKLRELNKESEE